MEDLQTPDNYLYEMFIKEAKCAIDSCANSGGGGDGGGGASSWNDLSDKPFFEDKPIVTVLFNGTVDSENASGGDPYYIYLEEQPFAPFEFGKTYRVVFDGIEYFFEPFNSAGWGEETLLIGNQDYCDNYVYTEGPPFYISTDVWNDPCVFFRDEGTHTLEVYLYERDIHKLDHKFIPTPDWNQHDAKAAGYIENRPFYDSIVVTRKVIFDGTINIDQDGGYGSFYASEQTIDAPIVPGFIHEVTYDGVTYTDLKAREQYGYRDLVSDQTLPFSISHRYEEITNVTFYGDSLGEHTFTIVQLEVAGELVKLDEKYIPETIVRKSDITQSDFDEDDKTKETYIKNRSHHRFVHSQNCVVYRTEVSTSGPPTNAPGQSGLYYYTTNDGLNDADGKPYFTLEKGKMYSVEFDGKVYNLTVKYEFGDPYIGTSYFIEDTDAPTDVDCPFAIQYIAYNGKLLLKCNGGKHTIEVVEGTIRYYPLDENYIPDTIARTADVPKVESEDWVFTMADGSTVTKKVAVFS